MDEELWNKMPEWVLLLRETYLEQMKNQEELK